MQNTELYSNVKELINIKIWEIQDKNKRFSNLMKIKKLIEKEVENNFFKFKCTPLDKDDLINISLFKVNESLPKFSPNRSKSLYSFVRIITKYTTINELRKYTSNAHKASNYSSSFIDEEPQKSFLNINYEEQLLLEIKDIINCNKTEFNKSEFKTLNLYLNDHSIKDIANILNKSNQSIYRYLDSASKKFDKLWVQSLPQNEYHL